jgi:hypothetical protein
MMEIEKGDEHVRQRTDRLLWPGLQPVLWLYPDYPRGSRESAEGDESGEDEGSLVGDAVF